MTAVRTVADTGTIFAVGKPGDRQARRGPLSSRANSGGPLLNIRWWPGTICVALVAIAFSATVLTIVARAEITRMTPPVASAAGKGDLLRRPETPNEPYAVVVTRGNGVLVLRRLR